MTQPPLVLLVDDEPILRDTLVQILEEEGIRAVSAADGPSAVRAAEQLRPDLVICDVVMPGTTGIEVAKRIRQMSPAVSIILFSGQAAATELIESAQSEGYNFEVLAKPIRPETLIGIVREQLNARESRLPQIHCPEKDPDSVLAGGAADRKKDLEHRTPRGRLL